MEISWKSLENIYFFLSVSLCFSLFLSSPETKLESPHFFGSSGAASFLGSNKQLYKNINYLYSVSLVGNNRQLHKNMNYLYSIASRFSNNQSS